MGVSISDVIYRHNDAGWAIGGAKSSASKKLTRTSSLLFVSFCLIGTW